MRRSRGDNSAENEGGKKAGLSLTRITPKTENQAIAFSECLENEKHLFLHGMPGTGKTFIAFYLATYLTLIRKHYQKISIIRSVVPTRQMGFLPGDEKKKSAVFEAPYVDAATKLFNRGDAYQVLKNRGEVEFLTTSFVRGTNLENAIVFVDEVQNMSAHELRSVVTRLGENTRLIMAGDITQDDLTSERYNEESGLIDMMQIFAHMESIAMIEFNAEDIVRSDFVKEFILAEYEAHKPQIPLWGLIDRTQVN